MIRHLKGLLRRFSPEMAHRLNLLVASRREPEIGLLPHLVEDGLAIDVGANKGLYVRELLRFSPSIVAFEPIPSLFQALQKRYGSVVRVEEVALSDSVASEMLRVPSGNTSWASLADSNRFDMAADCAVEQIPVETRTLDSYEFKSVSFIKIDVEGYEEQVLSGARETLQKWQPNLLIEIEERHAPGALSRVVEFLEGLGYRGYFLDRSVIRPLEEFDSRRDQDILNVGPSGKKGRYINNFVFSFSESWIPQGRF